MTSESILASLNNQHTTPDWQQLLSDILKTFGCSTGTLHFLNKSNNLLEIKAQIGIPEFLLPKVSIIPIGKGMAGIAAERMTPVEMCNLQTDESGIAKPSARDTKVEGSLAAPLILNDELFGVIGIAKPVPYDFTTEEINALMKIGEAICKRI